MKEPHKREPDVKWFFQPRPDGDGATHDEDDSAPGLISLPAELLQRHGAVVLDPAKAAAVHDYPTPRSTVYRVRTLLVPGDQLQDPQLVTALNRVLRGVNMMLIPPEPDEDMAGDGDVMEVLRQLPRPAVLVPAEGATVPVVVDAWVALAALRAAAPAKEHPEITKANVQRIELEHLMCASAITGSPIDGGGGGIPGGSGNGNGVAGPSSTDSYLFNGGDARTPVAVVMEPPARRSASQCASDYGRRAVVALLDTGAREQEEWLDVRAKPGGGYKTVADGFVAVDPGLQHAIRVEGERAASHGDRPRQVIRDPWDGPVSDDPLIGEILSETGHGVFEAGIIRQVVPDARVLAVRVMHSDGAVNQGDLMCALRHLARRIVLAKPGDIAAQVDVVSLSLGYFSESPRDVAFTSGLHTVIDLLRDLGVVVVAAAGNYSTTRRFYPAAFARPSPADQVPLISVGALNPNGSKAVFSDAGDWITCWAVGALVISAFPTDINASRSPELRMRAHPGNQLPPGVPLPGEREALDPDDYSGGCAAWSGTSFSAPLVAAHVVAALLKGAASTGSLRLNHPGTAAATSRALAALTALDWPG
jgi:subtilisin family serine protease